MVNFYIFLIWNCAIIRKKIFWIFTKTALIIMQFFSFFTFNIVWCESLFKVINYANFLWILALDKLIKLIHVIIFLYIYIDKFILCLFYLPFTEINNFHIIAFLIIINSQIMSEWKRIEESYKRFHQILTSERQTKRSKKAPIDSGGNNNNNGGNNSGSGSGSDSGIVIKQWLPNRAVEGIHKYLKVIKYDFVFN